jgi:hypothetical protein
MRSEHAHEPVDMDAAVDGTFAAELLKVADDGIV